jgi:hypothetical protein
MSARKDSHDCRVTAAELCSLSDGTAPAPGLDAHVAGCPHCRSRLAALRSQRDALAGLVASRDGADPGGTASAPAAAHPDRAGNAGHAAWVPAALRAGRSVAADLLAELAHASLARSQPTARHTALADLPRPIERIVADLRVLRARLDSLDELLPLAGLPDLDDLGQRPHGTPALARACLDALATLEGRSERHDALRARCH